MAFPPKRPGFPVPVTSFVERARPYEFITVDTGKPLIIFGSSHDFDGPNDVVMQGADDDIDLMDVEDVVVPEEFKCCITLEVMKDPWIDTNDGRSYEGAAIFQWLKKNKTSPCTRAPLRRSSLVQNFALRKAIREFRKDHPDVDLHS
jgi:hypothetical protein